MNLAIITLLLIQCIFLYKISKVLLQLARNIVRFQDRISQILAHYPPNSSEA